MGNLAGYGKAIYKALQLDKVSLASNIKDSLTHVSRTALLASRMAKITGNLTGDPSQTGGTFVIEGKTNKVLYELRQVSAGSYASLKELFEICGGDPDIVEEKAPIECIVHKLECGKGGNCYDRYSIK